MSHFAIRATGSKRRWLLAGALVPILPIALAAPATAAAPATHTQPVRAYSDYLPGSAAKATTDGQSTQAAQCGKPVAARIGAWICGDQAKNRSFMRTMQGNKDAAAKVSARTRKDTTAVPASNGEYCDISRSCWDVYGVTDADYYGFGTYGYGNTELGTAYVYGEVNITGGKTVTKPIWFESTHAADYLYIEGERLYISAKYPGGNAVSPSTFSHYGPVVPVTNAHNNWSPNGYAAYENTVQTGTVSHEMVWEVVGYPGSWRWYFKSVKFNMTSTGYKFGSPSYLPASPEHAGYFNG